MIADFRTSFPPFYLFCLFGPRASVFGASKYFLTLKLLRRIFLLGQMRKRILQKLDQKWPKLTKSECLFGFVISWLGLQADDNPEVADDLPTMARKPNLQAACFDVHSWHS